MIEITKYLQTVYEDLQRYVDNDVCLCKFKELNFDMRLLMRLNIVECIWMYYLRWMVLMVFR